MSAHSPDPRRGPIAGIVLAAGGGTRFGGPKQLAALWGRPLLEHSLAALAASPVDQRFVVLGAAAERVRAEVDLHGAEAVISERWAEGQASSLRAGIRAADKALAVVVILGDQPLVSSDAVERVIAAREPGVLAVRATYSGAPGHPVLLERELFGPAMELTGDEGARVLLGELGESLREVACDDLGSGVDVDTTERLAELEDGG